MDKNILHLILILFIVSILSKINYESYASNQLSNIKQNNAICFISRNLDPNLLNFAKSCSLYNDTYIIIDNNQEIKKISHINIIQINNDECFNNNYIKSTWRFGLDVSGWDKAFYYFCENNTYDNVWFIEDDVFIPFPDTLYNIDRKYNTNDLLIKDMINISNQISHNSAWIEKKNDAKKLLDTEELYWSWVCAMRCSKKLLNVIKKFKQEHNQLYFHEILIPSLVKINNLSYKTIFELRNIVYRKEYDDKEIISSPTSLYHPIKDYERQKKIRIEMINNLITN